MRISNESLIDAAVTLDGDFASRPIYLGHIAQYAIQLVFSGTPDGTFSLECSNDRGNINAQSKAEQSEGVVNWTTIAGSASVITAAGDITWNAENVGYLWVRVKFDFSASTGSLDSAVANMKGV